MPRAFALGLLFVLLSFSNASAHCFVGARFFPATLATDDPCVADEMSLPTVSWSKTGDIPPATEVDISGEISKRITEDFGVSIGESWSQIRQPGGPTMAGFADLETTFQYQLLKDDSHELAMLLGLIVEWGGTGATNAGIGTPYSVLTPTYYFGQGFGGLPDTIGWAQAARGHRPDRLSNPDDVLRRAARAPLSRRCSSTAPRCNTACPTSNPR